MYKILVEEIKIWKLSDTNLVPIADSQNIEGKIRLKKKLIVVDFHKQYCTYCTIRECLHFQATVTSAQYQYYSVCELRNIKDCIYLS
ncbi:hypothetical protein LOD99_6069 [Oopsacas minuta]|uniref:Uncharacterized protein n=1 Tax=Oopsacas minuta TaxID=111878 RepID=A0AAV7JN63_9METZ|nr:hypothetical protein LOD99_6069 [Oopsacas minuta]